jgi:hypothetical protein
MVSSYRASGAQDGSVPDFQAVERGPGTLGRHARRASTASGATAASLGSRCITLWNRHRFCARTLVIMQRGSAEIFLGLGLIIIGFLGLKLTDLNLFWACIALGAVLGCHGGIAVSQRARV